MMQLVHNITYKLRHMSPTGTLCCCGQQHSMSARHHSSSRCPPCMNIRPDVPSPSAARRCCTPDFVSKHHTGWNWFLSDHSAILPPALEPAGPPAAPSSPAPTPMMQCWCQQPDLGRQKVIYCHVLTYNIPPWDKDTVEATTAAKQSSVT